MSDLALPLSGSTLKLSVIMPVFNEASVIGSVIESIAQCILDVVPESELIIIDDRSTDGTPGVLIKATLADPRIQVLTNSINQGHGPSVRRGLDMARGEWIFHLDSHAQFKVQEFSLLYARRDSADLILGFRVNRDDPKHRLVLTRLTRGLVSVLAGEALRDANVPFKLLRRSLFAHLARSVPSDVFAPSILLAVGAVRSGARIVEVGVSHSARPFGKSKLHPLRLARISVRCSRELIRMRLLAVAPYNCGVTESDR